jgi:hypothetical protein
MGPLSPKGMAMQRRFVDWGRLWALCGALFLCAAPVIEAVKHGPGALAAEADHRVVHLEQGHSHDIPSGHHDSDDHDHVSVALVGPISSDLHAPPTRSLRPCWMAADGTIREGPRRPPRLMMT